MSRSGYEMVDHTADVALRVWAPRVEDLMLEASWAMLDLMFRPSPRLNGAREAERVQLALEGADRVSLLLALLNEILYLVEGEERIPVHLEVLHLSDEKLTVEAGTVPLDAGPPLVREIKAATYHDARLGYDRERDLWEITIVFDL